MSKPSIAGTQLKIQSVRAREVLDSRGMPTVEAEVWVSDPKHSGEVLMGRAIVPSGASTGEGEALELRDADPRRFLGKGVLKAVANVREKVAPAIVGRSFGNQMILDEALRTLDGTENKSVLGANALLSVSMAFLRATAAAARVPAYRVIADLSGTEGVTLPVPLMNILNGGKHADNGLALQEFMIAPVGFPKFSEALRAGAEVFHHLKKILHRQGLSTGVGDEGGFAPNLGSDQPHEAALQAIMEAIAAAGYRAGHDIFLALDAAASEFSERSASAGDYTYKFEGKRLTSSEMGGIYSHWCETYPILSIEDGMAEHDWTGWKSLTEKLGKRVQLVGDDLFVTNPAFLRKGVAEKSANSILIKLNQIGTVAETLETMALARTSGFTSIASHCSGESEDIFIADLAVGTDCGQLKTGSASRADRTAKYNQLLRIEEELSEGMGGAPARYAGRKAFRV